MAASAKALPTLVPIECAVMNYAWGKMGSSSAVAAMSARYAAPDADKPYAELWMGTHPSGPNKISGTNTSLLSHLGNKPLPFLFKVLSVAKALSIQAHPHKALAEQLHKERPDVYKDPNHKPEMALAVTPFQCMCGFRPPQQIAAFLKSYPELRAVAGEAVSSSFEAALNGDADQLKSALKALFSSVMRCEESTLAKQLDLLLSRLRKLPEADGKEADETSRDLPLVPLILRLSEQYPGDIGCFAPLLLNAFTLQPGQAIFLGPNEPHAYLDGDCVEAMAGSDNVVRAGLTPKLRDVDVLCEMLTYKAMYPNVLQGDALDKFSALYVPPVSEFMITRTVLPANTEYQLPAVAGPSLVLVYSGEGTADSQQAARGSTFLVSSGSTLPLASGKTEMLLFRCSENDRLKK